MILAAGGVALLISVFLTPAVRALGRRRNLLDSHGAAGHAKPALHAIPNIGGIAIFWAVAVAAAWFSPSREVFVILAVALGLHIVGLIDDRRPLGPAPKLTAQVLAGLVPPLVLDIRSLELLDGHVGGPWLSVAITCAWFVAIINALNFMDNMDGIAASSAAVAAAAFAVIAFPHSAIEPVVVAAAVAGAAVGFLVFNAPKWGGRRATIFMGDSGSLVLGFLLAYIAVSATYVGSPETARLSAVFVPLCVLAIPLYDLVVVCSIRVAQGKSPMVGDQQHFTHRLRRRGLSDASVCAVVAGCSAITALAGLILTRVEGPYVWIVAAQVGLILAVIALFEYGTSKRNGAP